MSSFRYYEPAECVGRDGYPLAWHESLKHAVREQAGHRCVRCRHPYRQGQGQWSPCDAECIHRGPYRYLVAEHGDWECVAAGNLPGGETGELVRAGGTCEARYRILTVHHLDGDKGNCRWWNLVALCQRCHLTIQGKVQMARVYPWPHSEWFKPYVAGYYAWVYLGEDLSREETEARLDELLALERAVA